MHVTDLRGLRIFSLMSALKMGTVEDVLFDPGCRYVAALSVREYGPGQRRLVSRESVKRVGRNAVILAGSDEMPEEMDMGDVDRLIGLHTLLGLEVVTDRGNLVGRIRDAVMDADTLAIETFEVARSPLERLIHRELPQRLDAHEVLSASKDVMIIPEQVMDADTTPEADPTGNGVAASARWTPPDMLDNQDSAGAAMGS